MFKPSGLRLRLTSGCTYTCILQLNFQPTFGAVCGKDEAPNFQVECVHVKAVRLALSLNFLQQTQTNPSAQHTVEGDDFDCTAWVVRGCKEVKQ